MDSFTSGDGFAAFIKHGHVMVLIGYIFLSMMQIISSGEHLQEGCQRKLYVGSGELKSINHGTIASADNKHGTVFCKYEIHTSIGNRIRIQIENRLIEESGHDEDCLENYIHIGNDNRRVGVDTLTSYKLCQRTLSEEIVSRGSYLWVIIRSLDPAIFSWLNIHYQSKEPVLCNQSTFQCSPVQCVLKSAICNGVSDCDNCRDEYCGLTLKGSKPPKVTKEPCFMCGDGSCITPSLPRYSLDWGKHYWYLCDSYNHCADGTDERKDICYRIKGRSTALFACSPKDRNITALFWNTVVCDGEEDCQHGEDEAPDLCTPATELVSIVEPASVIIPVAAIIAVCVGGLLGRAIYKMQDRRMSLPTNCLDTTYIFTEFSNSPTPVDVETGSKEECQLTNDSYDDPDDPEDIDLDDIDDDLDDDIDELETEETVFDVVTKTIQTTV